MANTAAKPSVLRRIPPKNPIFTTQQLLQLICPLLIEQTLAITVGMADTMMVSRCGEAAISGVSLVDMINLLIITIFSALATGGAVVVSQYLGAENYGDANRSAAQLILLSGLLGTAVGAFSLLAARQLISTVFGAIEPDVLEAGVVYLRITSLSYPFLALYNAGAALFRSMGNSRISMKVSILMNLINVAGNWLCIFVFKMGVAGVAWPSLVSRAVAAVLILVLCAKPGNMVRAGCARRINPALARRILQIGIPSAFENSLFQAGRVLVVSIIASFGTVQIAANAVANNLDGMGIIPGQAISLAMISVVGRCVGAEDADQTRYFTHRLMLWSILTLAASNGLILLFLPRLVGLYELTAETVRLATLLVRIHAGFAILLWAFAFVLPNALRAANDVRYTMLLSIFSMVTWRLGFSYLLGIRMGMGAVGVWIGMIVDWVCRTGCFVWRFESGGWQGKYRA